RQQAFEIAQGLGAVDAGAIGGHHQVARTHAGGFGGAAAINAGDHGAALVGRQAQLFGQPRVQVFAVQAEAAAAHFAVGQQLALDLVGQVGRDGETQADVAGGAAARV